MLKFTSKEQLKNASETEVIEFFNKVKFQGKFYPSIPAKFQESFCGRIENMSIGREHNDLCVPDFYVPNKFKDYVHPGLCEFICGVDLKQLQGTPSKYRLFIKRIYNKKTYNTANKRPTAYPQKHESEEEKILKRNLKLENNLFIGQFTQNVDGSFTIRDIRRSDFSKLILQNGKEQQPIVYHPKTRKPGDGKYYEFTWILNVARKEDYVYLFKVDETKPLKGINAHEVINRLNKSIMEYKADAGQKIVKMLETLKTQLTASGRDIFIYELLQNANDYPVKSNEEVQKVDVEFHITQHSLIFMHTGAEFNEKNIAAICSINDKEKTDNKDAIGYKGIGFKTVFLDNNYVYLKTGGFSFRFDKEETKDIVDTPWQILPIWTPYSVLSAEENQVFRNASNDFRVKFALRPTDTNILRNTDQNYTDMFKEVFANERVILFIPNLKSVKVFFGDTETPEINCRCDNDHWQVNNFEEPVDAETTKLLNEALDQQETSGSLKIPTKYYNFSKTKVSFACEKDGTELKECEDTQLYCYLPTRATWGFKFLMNTDMIPTGPRDDIEIDFANQININAEIAEMAGNKFFDWIAGLCKSNYYTKTSIFNLVPNFGDIKDKHGKYKSLIERFQTGFEGRIKTDELIPVGDDKYALISDVVFDETRLSSSGIMSDEEFLRFTGKDGYSLPLPELRNDEHFNSFLRRYVDDEQQFSEDDLRDLIANDDFQEWLKDQENNNKFLQFLLDNNYLDNLLNEKIFLGNEGSLHAANKLYYDVDKYLDDLEAFTDHIAFLSRETREYFKGNTKWERDIDNKFAEFDCGEFVDETLLDFYQSETIERLKDKDTSVHFYKFLAENVRYCDRYLNLPFFDTNNNVVEGFSGRFLFFPSERGEMIGKSQWLSEINIIFISSDYAASTKEYFQEHFGVREYSDEVIVKKIILSSSNQSKISNAIDNDFDTSRDFVRFCFVNRDIIPNGELSIYTLKSSDCNGDELWSNENVFFDSSCFEYYSQKKWLGSDWMTVIDKAYFADYALEEFKEFLHKTFGVKELTDTTFYTDVVRPNLRTIFENTSGSADSDGSKNFDFVKYLDDNYKLIFTEKKDSDRFGGFILVNNDNCDVAFDTVNLCLYNEGLKEIVEANWFPSDLVTLCSPQYGNSNALKELGIKQYIPNIPADFGNFFNDVIVSNIESINGHISCKEESDFVQHNSCVTAFTSSDSWVILSPIEQSIKRKIEAAGTPLKDWNIQINYGIKTGCNEAFIISTEKRDEILANCRDEEERKRTEELIRPILRGRDIRRYSYDWAGLYLIYVPWHFPYQFDDSITGASQKAEEAFKNQYPAVYEHLEAYKDVLSKRNQAETGIRYEWYALQRWGAKYWEDFFKPKIIYMEIQTDNPEDGYPFPCFSFDDNNAVVLNTAYIMCGEKDEITYILGVLNSSVGRYIAKYYVTQLQQRQFRMLAQYVGNFPIPKVDADEMRTVSKLVCNHFENQSSNDSCINEAIYHLYGLNENEIGYVKQH